MFPDSSAAPTKRLVLAFVHPSVWMVYGHRLWLPVTSSEEDSDSSGQVYCKLLRAELGAFFHANFLWLLFLKTKGFCQKALLVRNTIAHTGALSTVRGCWRSSSTPQARWRSPSMWPKPILVHTPCMLQTALPVWTVPIPLKCTHTKLPL